MGETRCGGGECGCDVFHHQERALGVLADIVDMDDVRRVEAGCGTGLS